jgi:hypothetical protein
MRVAAIPALPRRFANLSSHRRVSNGTRILKVAVADMCEKYKMFLPLSSLHFSHSQAYSQEIFPRLSHSSLLLFPVTLESRSAKVDRHTLLRNDDFPINIQ